jgi:DNA-binding SARP family transcriptional activator
MSHVRSPFACRRHALAGCGEHPQILGREDFARIVNSLPPVPTDGLPEAGAQRLSLHVLGRLELVSAEGVLRLGPGKPLALLAYLRSQSVHSATRPHLIDLLWSDLEPERARANLRQALLVLRRLLPDDALVSDGDLVILRAALTFDRDEFVAAADRGDFAAAIALYRGDFIPDLAVPGGAEFEMWCDIERRHLAALFARLLETVARADLAAGRAAAALPHARRLRDMDASRERSWRLLIEAEIAAEGVASARLEAERLAELLRNEGRPPEPATAQLFQRVRDVARPSPERGGALSAPEFVGRETQLARVLAAWGIVKRGRRQHLHVEALAGTGKTRLLEESCARLQAAGARVVRCGARRDERDVPFALGASVVTALARLPGSIAVAPGSMAALVAMAPDASTVFAAHADTATGDEAMRRRTVALADLLGAVTHEASVVLAIDDAHWADRASLNLLLVAMGRLAADARVLLLTAGREPWAGETGVERVSLPPLTTAQVDAMLQSLGGAGDAAWWDAFAAALRDAAGGVPFHVLQLLHAVVEKQLLMIDAEHWAAPNVPALLAALDASEAARMRVAQLSVEARAVLRVLCVGAAPSTEVVAAAVSAERTNVESVLLALEVRGYARRMPDGGWATAHDEITDLIVAQSDAPSLASARLGLALALAAEQGVGVVEMRRIIALLVQAGSDDEVAGVLRAWVRRGEVPAVGVPTVDLLPPGLSDERTLALRTAVRRTLPRRGRDHRTHWAFAAVLALLVIGAWYLTRPAKLVMVQAPIPSNGEEVMDRAPVIGVHDRLGRRLRVTGLRVSVRGAPGQNPGGRLTAETVDGEATFDSLSMGRKEGQSSELNFEAKGLTSVRWIHEWIGGSKLRLRSGVINGQLLSGPVPVVRVRPGEPLVGRVSLLYSSLWTTATVFLGATATWERRETDTASVRSLVTPLDSGRIEVPVRRVAPLLPGRYLLLWAFGAEPRAAFIFSSTNWTCGEPRWRNGDDLLDLPLDTLRAAALEGAAYWKIVRCWKDRGPVPPYRVESPIGIAAVEVHVSREP